MVKVPRWVSPLRCPGGKAKMTDCLAGVFDQAPSAMEVEVWVEPFAGGLGAGLTALLARDVPQSRVVASCGSRFVLSTLCVCGLAPHCRSFSRRGGLPHCADCALDEAGHSTQQQPHESEDACDGVPEGADDGQQGDDEEDKDDPGNTRLR